MNEKIFESWICKLIFLSWTIFFGFCCHEIHLKPSGKRSDNLNPSNPWRTELLGDDVGLVLTSSVCDFSETTFWLDLFPEGSKLAMYLRDSEIASFPKVLPSTSALSILELLSTSSSALGGNTTVGFFNRDVIGLNEDRSSGRIRQNRSYGWKLRIGTFQFILVQSGWCGEL